MQSPITITKLKDIRGRKIVGYKAALGAFVAQGATPAEAHAGVVAKIAAHEKVASLAPVYLFTESGTVLHLHYSVPGGGYEYDQARPGAAGVCAVGPFATYGEALRNALRHAETGHGGVVGTNPAFYAHGDTLRSVRAEIVAEGRAEAPRVVAS